ncbi:hypothetical protein Ade02nite_34650 [Paractinoplanes deccanensis]|uniref:Transposase n=1 Tax=Paractinoplanes deccanensis TaxID=113561 RepID=A0ABQ3Y4A4_9ACTN|nr:hypothetical protein Ade02nite_34650 [Actinoplanes deccanensis]
MAVAKRVAARTGAWICFADECGQTLRASKATTWAPRGVTPVVKVTAKSSARVSELNPAEKVWSTMKRSLANHCLRTGADLLTAVKNRLKRQQYRPALLDGYLTGTGLSPPTPARPQPRKVSSLRPSGRATRVGSSLGQVHCSGEFVALAPRGRDRVGSLRRPRVAWARPRSGVCATARRPDETALERLRKPHAARTRSMLKRWCRPFRSG